MKAGHFTRSYEHWRYTSTTDAWGQPIESWAKQGDIKGRAYPGAQSEIRNQAIVGLGKILWTFACAADEEIERGDEIRFDGRALTVTSVAVTSRGHRIEAMCEELQ